MKSDFCNRANSHQLTIHASLEQVIFQVWIWVKHNLIKMGCISSKVLSRSTSFREQLNLLQRKANSVTSGACVANEPLLGSFSSESNSCTKAADDLEKNASFEQEEKNQMQPASPLLTIDADLAKRSKSCRWFQEHQVPSLPLERSDEIKEERSMWSKSDKIRAWSFHTVEEYDAMIERICISMGEQTGFDGKDAGSLQLHHSKSSSQSPEHAQQAMKQSPLKDESQVQENIATEEDILFTSRQQTTGVIQSPNNSGTIEGPNVVEDGAQNFEKGFKRKAMANELELLKMPTTIEFQGAASHREFLHVGWQVYSPGAYVTPKFGSYSIPIDSGSANKCIDSTIFDPELVAAFEDCMEQLEVEEESILKQIEENFNGDRAKENQDQEEIPLHTNDQL